MRPTLPIFLFLSVAASAETDYLGRCGKEGLMPPGLNPVPGRKYARDRFVDIKHLALEVTPDFTRRSVQGEVTITFSPVARALTKLELDAVDLTIDAVGAAGAKVSGHEVTKEKLIITLAEALPAGAEAAVTVRYHCQPDNGLYFRTPELGYPAGDTQVWSQGEAEFHRYWFPCYDYPNDRFTSEVICHAPDGMEVVSNGKLVSRERAKDGGLVRWHWKQEQPHVNYLMALAAGYFHRIDAQAGKTPLAVLVPPSEKAQAALAFRDTQAIMQFYEKETGTPYPWDKYFSVYCLDFLAGGMENTSCTFNAAAALFPQEVGELDTVHRLDAHELAHQWFGDLLTCRDWSHLWLNEGFASYYTVLYEEVKNGRDGMALSLWREAQRVLNSNDTRPIVWRDYSEPMEQFDSRAYPKGAWVLHMLRSQLGPDLYRAAIKEYIARHRNGIVTSDDLQETMEDVSGRSFDQFFDQWVHHGGVPELAIEYSWDAATKMARVAIKQTQKVDEKVLLFSVNLPLRFTVKAEDGKETMHDFTAAITKAQEDFHFPLAAQPALLRIDPDLTVLAKINFTPAGEMLKEQLKSDIIGRMLAVQQLGKKKDDATVKQLTEIVSGDPHHAIKTEAVEALQQVPGDTARAALISLTSQPDERVRKAVADALAGILHPDAHAALVKMAATEQNPIIVSSIVEGFAAWPQEDLVPFLKRASYQNMVAAAAIRTLRLQNRQDALPAIIAAVKAGGFPARALGGALSAIGTLARGTKDQSIQPLLAGYLTFPHRAVRTAAASALGELGDLRAIPALNAVASQKTNPAANAAADAVGKIQALQTTPAQTIEAGAAEAVFVRLREILRAYSKTLTVSDDTPARIVSWAVFIRLTRNRCLSRGCRSAREMSVFTTWASMRLRISHDSPQRSSRVSALRSNESGLTYSFRNEPAMFLPALRAGSGEPRHYLCNPAVMKKTWFPALFLLAGVSAAPALDHLLIIGDSLSKEYEFEGPGVGVDIFPIPSPYPKNWCELLDDRRKSYFDFGDTDGHSDIRVLGHDYNWSVPGSFASDWRDDYLANPPSALEEQLSQTLVKRIVIWLGGNDVRSQYGPLYEGQLDPATWATQTYDDLAFVLDWVLARRQPGVHLVLVNVAHLGATISKNRDHPFDPVKTGRVTAALDDLNARLAALANARGVGLANIYGLTREWVTLNQVSIGGWVVTKRSSGEADPDAMFLDDGFHPNMPIQAIFGQIILDTFNARYGTSIPRLTNREIVDKCLEVNPDFTFSQWAASYGLPAAEQGAAADPDKDGVRNIVEFGLDLDPSHADSHLLPQPRASVQSGQNFVTLTWQPRDPTNAAFCEITLQQSSGLQTWTDVPASAIVSGSPNTMTANSAVGSNQRGWFRLQVRQTGP